MRHAECTKTVSTLVLFVHCCTVQFSDGYDQIVPTITDDETLLMVKALRHFDACLRAMQREEGAFKELADKLESHLYKRSVKSRRRGIRRLELAGSTLSIPGNDALTWNTAACRVPFRNLAGN
jgi:hypothetical protein